MSAFKDKVVLVTGGSRGIGRSIAVAFAKQGATVVISYAGNEAAAQETLGLIQAAGAKGEAVRFDVADSAACAGAVDNVVKTHGRLDVLVNNAGVSVDGLVMRVKDEDWDRQLDTNLKGAFALIRAASRPMMKQRGGAIINLTSVVGEMGNGGQAAYSASKAGLIGLTKSVARELSSRNIRVNAVSPGFIGTDMSEFVKQTIPAEQMLTTGDVAEALRFLLRLSRNCVIPEIVFQRPGDTI
jgi:3-oxoacyl-[acyl-carrier protein] reductase